MDGWQWRFVERAYKWWCRFSFVPDEIRRSAWSHHLGEVHELRPAVASSQWWSRSVITIGITLGAAALLVYLALRNPAPQPAQASGRFQLPSQPDDQTCSSWRQI